jgi:3-methyladenine DNA glycosylase AlkD
MAAIAAVRTKAKSIAKQHKDDPKSLVALALRTAKDGDEQLAFELFRAAPKAVATMSLRQIESLLPSLHDWNSIDCFGSFVSGPAWREGVISDTDIHNWTASESRWVRRAALVSTVPLNLPARGATAPKGDAKKTLAVCLKLIDDRDDMVVKALSWAIRVLAMKDPDAAAGFIQLHQPRLAARVLREARNKLTTGLKNPRPKRQSPRSNKAPSTPLKKSP